MASVDEEGGGSFSDNNDGNNSRITKMDNDNNSSHSEGSINQREQLSPGKLKLWYDQLSVVQQSWIEMNVNAMLYLECMTAAPQLFGTMVRQQEADDDDDDDNVVGDWEPGDDLVVGGGVLPKTMIRK